MIIAVVYWLWKTNEWKDVGEEDDGKSGWEGITFKKPTALPATENRFSKDDHVWIRFKDNGHLYFGDIVDATSETVNIAYYDGVEEAVSREDIFYLAEAKSLGYYPHALWKNRGMFYHCNILEYRDDTALVEYVQNKEKEEMPYRGIIFMKEPAS